MKFSFRDYVRVTKGFFALRFLVAAAVSVLYLFVASLIQYGFVRLLGESTFNYIAGGVMSLVCGLAVVKYAGDLVLMFVKGWHVSALAYAKKIDKSKTSAVDVGMRVFRKHLLTFGAVYGVREIVKNFLADFKTRLWDILADVPHVNILKRFATSPIVEHISGDVLHYGFDATVFYLIRHPADDIDAVPEVTITAVKKYLYCLPEIMFSSVQAYMMFRFFPNLIKYLIVISFFLTKGIVAGILINVLMIPIFYILDTALFDPLTMIFFLAVFARKCDKEVDENSAVAKIIKEVLSGETAKVETKKEDEEEKEEEEPVEEEKEEPVKEEAEESPDDEKVSSISEEDEIPSKEEELTVDFDDADAAVQRGLNIQKYATHRTTAEAFKHMTDEMKPGTPLKVREQLESEVEEESKDEPKKEKNPYVAGPRMPEQISNIFSDTEGVDLLEHMFNGDTD